MSASKKAIENSHRLRYIRALERFHKSIVSYLLNSNDLTNDRYNKKIENSLKVLQRVEEIALYKGELQDLQLLVKKMISLKESDRDIEDIRDELLYSSNQLDKSKNAKKYKKDKHVNSKYDEWD